MDMDDEACYRAIETRDRRFDGLLLTGYGGGLERKRWLLEHEGAAFHDDMRRPSRAA